MKKIIAINHPIKPKIKKFEFKQPILPLSSEEESNYNKTKKKVGIQHRLFKRNRLMCKVMNKSRYLRRARNHISKRSINDFVTNDS